MANSPVRLPVSERPNNELLEDLCLKLRCVGVDDHDLPSGEPVVRHIAEVVTIHSELERRGADWRPRVMQLSLETKWQMIQLLADCVAYPKIMPFVRDADGISKTLRCRLCAHAERPMDAKLFWFCNSCMTRVLEALRTRTPLNGIILFRTYNVECGCMHSNADTVLATELYSDQLDGVCEVCINDELKRRGT